MSISIPNLSLNLVTNYTYLLTISDVESEKLSDRPLVSFIKKITNAVPKQQFTANMKKHPCN